ncbi:MAG: hypothetical protein HY518_01175 [Candidatus Aenigmarchaeota archaeon]|nr:hypothetical protein [Candidatus Aenigmarchaeota archaeon]
MDELVIDKLREFALQKKRAGKFVFGSPFEMEIHIDYTCPRGGGSNLYYSYVFQMPKWGFTVKKFDESIEVTPEFAEFYNITIGQKQKLESEIKAGLTSAAQAVADFELMKHDSRRYKEILDYFVTAEKKGDQHVLRNIFVDRVDAFTGDFALIQIVKRWPSIISDFLRMPEKLTDVQAIRKELDVTAAEANILKTKNELYKEWKKLFRPAITERYARIETLVQARRKSVEEYRNWLKPYIAKFRMIKEMTEANPGAMLSNPYFTPGFGQSQATTTLRILAWRPFTPGERGKPESLLEKKGGHKTKFVLNPYDSLVREWKGIIEQHYGITITDKDVRDVIDAAVKNGEMDPKDIYYVMFDVKLLLNLSRTPPPEGAEIDDVNFQPLKGWFTSQNIILIHLLELYAREKAIEKYINEMTGAKQIEEEWIKKIEAEFTEKKPERFEGLKKFGERVGVFRRRVRSPLEKFFYLFVRPGPYEPVFEERISKMYARVMGEPFDQIITFITSKIGVE